MFKPLDKKEHKLNTYKFIAVLSSVVMFSLCLTGCGGNTAGENTADVEDEAVSDITAKEESSDMSSYDKS